MYNFMALDKEKMQTGSDLSLHIYEVNMEQFRNIDEILAGNFIPPARKTDRVLKSTRIEQAIFDDLSTDAEELAEYTAEGSQKLRSFNSLVNDIFQSVYGLRTRYNDEGEISALAREFNRAILAELMADENYAAVKSVCEGKELPAIGATEEFAGKLVENLDGLMERATGGNGKVDALDKMEQDARELSEKLADLIERHKSAPSEQLERKIVATANRIRAKKEQSAAFSERVRQNLRGEFRQAIAASTEAALERAQEIESVVLAWGDGDAEMRKNAVNMEILRRTAKSQKLRQIAKFLGRYKEMLNVHRLTGYSYGCGEKYDIEYGSSINRVLTSELAMLASPELIPLFLRKYQNKSLKQYRHREPERKGGGDIIVCLDESSSTFGENNAYGMAIAMVLYEICRVNHANFALVHFSSTTKVDFFSKDTAVEPQKLLDCAETLLGGGTDFEKPLREALALAAGERMERPDVVFITDGVCDVSEEFLERFDEFKADTGARLTGILLDRGECFEFSLRRFADKVYRTSELEEDEIVERTIHTFTR